MLQTLIKVFKFPNTGYLFSRISTEVLKPEVHVPTSGSKKILLGQIICPKKHPVLVHTSLRHLKIQLFLENKICLCLPFGGKYFELKTSTTLWITQELKPFVFRNNKTKTACTLIRNNHLEGRGQSTVHFNCYQCVTKTRSKRIKRYSNTCKTLFGRNL